MQRCGWIVTAGTTALDPVLAGISIFPNAASNATWTGRSRSKCNGAGCDIEKYAQVVASNFPNQSNVKDTIDSTVDRTGYSRPMTPTDAFPGVFLPGIRFGHYDTPGYPPGYVLTTPYATNYMATRDWDGAWFRPDRRFCNPLEWLVSTKMAIAHSGVTYDRRSAVIITKMVICLKANCTADDATCAPRKCYVSKTGKCVKMNSDWIDTDWAERLTRTHSLAAYNLYESGAYTEPCDEAAEISAEAVIAGN